MGWILGLLVAASAVATTQAQQAPCTVVANVAKELMPYPLQPLPPGGQYYPAPLTVPERGMAPRAFVAHEGLFHHIPIVSVEPDDGPRRIVLVETFGEGWRGRVRQWEGKAPVPPELTAVLSVARPQDSFALLAIGGPRVEVPFGSRRETLQAAIDGLAHPDPNGPDGPGLFDGLLEAASWFGPAQVGDSILEFGGIRGWRWDKGKASQLRGALVSRGIRLFSLGGAYQTGGGDDYASGAWESPFGRLCEQTGGDWGTIGYLGRNARDEMWWEWREAAKALYEEATFAYILRLPRTGPRVKIQLTPAASKPGVLLSYPRPLPVCPPPPAASAEGQKTK